MTRGTSQHQVINAFWRRKNCGAEIPGACMDITRASLNNPAAVAAALALMVLFGALAMFDLPQMSVVTNWRAASPTEIESEILEPQEEVLQGMPGMEEMEGNAFAGGSFVNLTFEVGTDMQAVLVDVLGRLNRLPPMPADADPPVVQLSAKDTNQNLTYFFVQLLPAGRCASATPDREYAWCRSSVDTAERESNPEPG
ncbi:MAG: efflux RND transporter permease subunit [Xanthomonadales bacterium]|nr:efflux RND transporter permease subunit [Xanthomonadales bacterium]